jgi:hypothetical protein
MERLAYGCTRGQLQYAQGIVLAAIDHNWPTVQLPSGYGVDLADVLDEHVADSYVGG